MNKNNKTAGKYYKSKSLAPRACVDRVFLTFYKEQLIDPDRRFSGEPLTEEELEKAWEILQETIRTFPKDKWQIVAIYQYRDPAEKGWSDEFDKPHIHVAIRCIERYTEGSHKGETKQIHVNTFLNELEIKYQIKGDHTEDKNLWDNAGVIYCADFAERVLYLLHKTPEAKAAGKEPYELEELVSNLTIDEIKKVLEGYVNPSDALRKVTPKQLAELAKEAFDLGWNLRDYDAWFDKLPFNIMSQMKMKTIKERYDRGVDLRLKELGAIPRLSVFIQSPPAMGKTYAAKYACDQMGLEYLPIEAGGTGKFDDLTVTHGAIVVDDETLPHPLAMADTKYCRVYRRNRGNRPWLGKLLVITSNYSFDKWIEKCGIKDEEEKEAAKSRFYICQLEEVDGVNMLVCNSRAKRGAPQLKREIREMYEKFRDFFNESLAKYKALEDDGEDNVDVNGRLYWERLHRDYEKKERAEAEEAERKAREEEERKRQKEEEAERKKQFHENLMENLRKKREREAGIDDRLKERAKNFCLFRYGSPKYKWQSTFEKEMEIYRELKDDLHKKAVNEFKKANRIKGFHRTTESEELEIVRIMTQMLDKEEERLLHVFEESDEEVFDWDEEDNYEMTEEEMEALDKEFGAIFR